MKRGNDGVVLRGAQAGAGRRLCERIADDIAARIDDGYAGPAADPRWRVHGAILCEGNAGIAEFLALAARAFDSPRHDVAARRCLAAAATAVAEVEMTHALFSGFTGIAWSMHRANGAAARTRSGTGDDAGADPCAEVDDFLSSVLASAQGWQPFDLMTGAAGVALYALERPVTPAGDALLSSCVDALCASARRCGKGRAWPVPLGADAPAYLRETYPPGTFPLGAAHGAAGVIGVLARVVARRPHDGRARALLDDAVSFLLASRLPGRAHHSFPRVANDDGGWPDHSDISWCWGDPGIALSLWTAGSALGDARLHAIAWETMRNLCHRPPDVSEFTDACLCHGWAGAAHAFGRFHQATGDPHFAVAAGRYWQVVLDRAVEPGVAGGLLFRNHVPDGGITWRENLGILNGAAGVGLALLAALGLDGASGWDRMLGCASDTRTT